MLQGEVDKLAKSLIQANDTLNAKVRLSCALWALLFGLLLSLIHVC